MKSSELIAPKFKFESTLNWEDWREEFKVRLATASLLSIPHLPIIDQHNGRCFIVGAGPSLANITARDPCDVVMSLNGSHNWLIKRGIIPNIHVISEYDLEDTQVSLGGTANKGVTYYLASHCHPNIFGQLRDFNRVLWHAALPPQEFQQEVARLFPGEPLVNGGYATFFKSMAIGAILGYRNFEIFGVDSSCGSSSHVSGYVRADIEPKIKVWATDPTNEEAREYVTQGGLAFQAVEFLELCKAYHPELRIKVHGDGMLRYLHRSRYPELYKD